MPCHVSAHAAIRWLERIKGIDLSALRSTNPTDAQLLGLIEQKTGLTREAIDAAILANGVAEALACGATSIKKPGYTVVASARGVIITVLGKGQSVRRFADRKVQVGRPKSRKFLKEAY